MAYYIVAPAGISSGGPELAHQMCRELINNGCEAYMYYLYADSMMPVDIECVEKYDKYDTTHEMDFAKVNQNGNIVVVPEGLVNLVSFAKVLSRATLVLWWMSVDNYFVANSLSELAQADTLFNLHLVQSKYAETFLTENGICEDKILYVSDYISDKYGQFIYPAEFRKDIALFNPKKGLGKLKPVMDRMPHLNWIPLINLSEDEMLLYFEIAKVYIDFGGHPGRDRIPREAAVCGCCVVTNRMGSAGYHEDVPIDNIYKVDTDADYIIASIELIDSIVRNYAVRVEDFKEYREWIKDEINRFKEDVKCFITKMEGCVE